MKEMYDTLLNATKNETSKDKLYEFYHHFLTDKKTVVKTPTNSDYLSVIGAGNNIVYVYDGYGRVLSPNFVNGKTFTGSGYT